MAGFDELFQGSPKEAKNPKVRYWQERQDSGTQLKCQLVRERDGLSFGPTLLYVLFLEQNGTQKQSPDEIAWDPRINDELISMKVRAATEENESRRFALVLRDRFEEPEERFGDGFFNSVLIDYIDHSPFADLPAIQKKRAVISEYQPYKEGSSYRDCKATLHAVLVRTARELLDLYNEQDRAEKILANALADYLDERFSITNRELLGFTTSGRSRGC